MSKPENNLTYKQYNKTNRLQVTLSTNKTSPCHTSTWAGVCARGPVCVDEEQHFLK